MHIPPTFNIFSAYIYAFSCHKEDHFLNAWTINYWNFASCLNFYIYSISIDTCDKFNEKLCAYFLRKRHKAEICPYRAFKANTPKEHNE